MEIFSIILTKEQYESIEKKNLFSNPQWSNDGKLVWIIPAILMTAADFVQLFPALVDNDLVVKVEPRKFRNL